MEFRILGPLEASEGGAPVVLAGGKQRALLAVLLLHANEVVPTERLIEALWEEPPVRATKAVQVYVARLRKALGGAILVSRPPGYLLRVSPEQVDLARFRRLREQARNDRGGAAELLAEALALWRGPALAEFATEPFAHVEELRLEEERLAALEERVEAELVLGRHAALVAELEALVAAHPLRERPRGQLMLALYRCGRQADALAVFERGRRSLVEELGIEPGHELRGLQRAILNQEASLDVVAEEVAAESSGRGVFVGRRHELEQLATGLDEALAGRGRLFLLVGEPGIGKSWLADELLARARARGARVLVGRCWEAGGAPPYWPWVQSLRVVIRASAPERLREQLGSGGSDLAPLFPELRELFPDLPEPLAPESESARFRLFDAASSFLRAAAAARPIVLFLDDLHAADEPSLLLLRFLARELGESRLLVLGAYRDVDPAVREPLRAALADLARESVTRRIELAGLTESEVAEYIARSTDRAVDDLLAATVCSETQGNPLFVAELTRLLEGADTVHGIAFRDGRVPEGVREVIGRRLQQLSVDAERLLTAASVLGREFSLEALAPLSGVASDPMLDSLDEAIAARIIGELPGAPHHLRFAHVLFRDTLYHDLSAPRRRRLHRQAGEVLETVYANRIEAHLAELAHHFAAAAPAGVDDKALIYARRAGDRAAELLAFEEATRLYRLALDLLDADELNSRELRCELLIALADVQTRAGDMPAARQDFLQAAALAGEIGSGKWLARAALGYGGRLLFTRATEGDQLVALLERAAASLGGDQSRLRVLVLARLANAVSQQLPEQSDSLSTEALAIARRLHDPADLAYAISARLYATRAPTDLDERWALTCELIDAADRERVFEGHAYRTIIHFARGEIPEIRADLAAMAQIAEELAQPAQRWWVAATSTTLALLEGRFNDAEHLSERARTLGEHAQDYDALNFHQLQRFALRREQGRLAEVLDDLQRTVEADPTRPILRCALAVTHWQLGQRQDAKRVLNELAADDFAQLPINNDWLLSAALLAELIAATADTDRGDTLYRRLLPYDGLNVDTEEVSTGATSRYLGLLATTSRHFEQAARHFQDALALNERIGARPWLARTQHDYAKLLLTRDKPGDRERAHDLLRTARATYRELHIQPYNPVAAASARPS